MTDPCPVAMRTSLARLVVLAGALAGLFAMHGLGDHASAHVGFQHAHVQVVSSSHVSGAAGVDHLVGMSDGADEVAPLIAAAMAPVDTSSGTDMGLMGLCLAVLAGALLFFGPRGALTGCRVRLARDLGGRSSVIGTTSRERDPPCLAQLSILRC